MKRLRIAVVGVGHLGKEHARILAGMSEVELVGVADVVASQAEAVALRCNTRAFTDYQELLPLVDAAVVVTPTMHHHAVASAFLRRGIPLLVEKPLAATLADAEELADMARLQGVVLQVGHIERFNPAFENLQDRPLQPKYILGHRLGLFTGRSTDIGAVLDLMIHDLDLVLALLGSPVQSVEAIGVSIVGRHEDMAHARLTFANGCIADLAASRISLQPSRRMQIWGPEGYAALDFARKHLTMVQPSPELSAVSVWEGEAPAEPGTQARRKPRPPILLHSPSDLIGRHLQVLELDGGQGDQLTRELEDFVRCVRTGSRPRVSGEDGRNAVELASRIVASLEKHAWNGDPQGARGPLDLPPALGSLFSPPPERQAA